MIKPSRLAGIATLVLTVLLTAATSQAAEKSAGGPIALGPDGCTMYISHGSSLERVNVCTNQSLGAISLAAIPDSTGIADIKALSDGTLLVAAGPSVDRLDARGSLLASYDIPGNNCWAGLTLVPGAASFWALSSCGGDAALFDLAGAALQVLHIPDSEPAGGMPIVHGRQMFGGGTTYTTTGVQVNHGASLHCDSSEEPNTLQIVWTGGSVFFLEHVTSVSCTGSPFNTMSGAGTGTINGQGPATVEWTLVDAGEPGSLKDTARFVVRNAAGQVVIEVSGQLLAGNNIAK